MKRASDRNFFELAFLATETEASAGISALAAHFRSLGLSEEHAGEVRIALTEAINNVVEHAYAGVEPAQVRINCRQTQDRLDILVSDTGNPLPGGKVPAVLSDAERLKSIRSCWGTAVSLWRIDVH